MCQEPVIETFPLNLQDGISRALSWLERGGVAAFPTDTLYGLGASAFDTRAVERVFQIKGRPMEMGLPLLLGDVSDLENVAVNIPEVTWQIVARFWPGPLTLVLKKSSIVPNVVTGGRDTVAVRVPDHVVPTSLAKALGMPITGTSANKSGSPGAVSAQEVREQLRDSVDFILEGGICSGGNESTMLDLTGDLPTIIRRGVILPAHIQTACQVPIVMAAN